MKQPRNPWSDGPEYITQCPIQPGAKFSQKIIFSTEEGTIWWHAHSDWSRATVHGAIIVYPKYGTGYPFPKPWAEVPILLGMMGFFFFPFLSLVLLYLSGAHNLVPTLELSIQNYLTH